jgi:hypothetical protein
LDEINEGLIWKLIEYVLMLWCWNERRLFDEYESWDLNENMMIKWSFVMRFSMGSFCPNFGNRLNIQVSFELIVLSESWLKSYIY